METNQITTYEEFLKLIHSTPFDDLLKLTNENCQPFIVKVMMNSFTDPAHIQMFIDKFSPNEEIKETRNTIWKLLR